jgi:hypothetical protein
MRSLILSGLVTASLAFGNSAMAANVHAKPVARAPASHTNVAARYSYPAGTYPTGTYPTGASGFGQPYGFGQPFAFGQPQVNPQQIISSLLSSPLVAPYLAQYGGRIRVTRGSGGGTYEPSYDPPTYDTSSPPDTSIQDMLNNQAQQQTSDEINEVNEMNATAAADASQAAADNAAMTQQIMNNGGL